MLSEDQTATLLLVAAGLSNKTTGRILGISEKTVESRLNNLFLRFAVNAKANKVINPRLRLIAIAHSRQNITFEAFQEIWQKTNNVDMEQIVNSPQELRETLFRLAGKLVEEAPRYRDNAHRERMFLAQQRAAESFVNPAHVQSLYNRLNPYPQQTKTNPQEQGQ